MCTCVHFGKNTKVPVFHTHFSSIRLRGFLGVENTTQRFFCPSCKSSHGSYPEPRTKIVISDSTLHNFFAPPGPTSTEYEGDIQHVDYITIPGACLDTLFHAFKIDYANHHRPMDICVVAGYNDILKDHSRDYIVDTLAWFTNYVIDLGNKNNTVAVATLLYPPRLAWLQDNGPEPPRYQNQKAKIDFLNGRIDDVNLSNGVREAPGLHKFGIKSCTRKSKDKFGQEHHRVIRKHRWEQWREMEKRNKLHLSNERRFKVGQAVNSYFVVRT